MVLLVLLMRFAPIEGEVNCFSAPLLSPILILLFVLAVDPTLGNRPVTGLVKMAGGLGLDAAAEK